MTAKLSGYRADIDGLRAIAVLPVLLFHAHVPGFTGGYIGVDIFFVISGYLITGILLNDLDQSRFSILRFYERRVRRIFPALCAVLLGTLVASWWLLLPAQLNDLGNSLPAATFFYANYHYMFEAGYFSAPAESQPLLHTWSLAVEEQFYIVFPLLLFATWRFFSGNFRVVISLLFFVSLGYSAWLVQAEPQSAFFSTPARAWELLLGSWLAMSATSRAWPRAALQALAGFGLLAILASIFVFTRATVFPGPAALLPCLGAAAIIYAGSQQPTIASQLLAWAPLRAIGLISYSLYLWHWPVLVLFRLQSVEPVSAMQTAALLALTLLLSILSWRFVEQPFRQRKLFAERAPIFRAALVSMLAFLAIGVSLSATDGFPDRFDAQVSRLLAAQQDRLPLQNCRQLSSASEFPLRGCLLGDTSAEAAEFLLWGDSHAEALWPGIDQAARQSGQLGLYLGRDGCLPLLGAHQVRETYASCVPHAEAVLEFLAGQPQIRRVLLASRWGLYVSGQSLSDPGGEPLLIRDAQSQVLSVAENERVFGRALERSLDALAAQGRHVTVLAQVPESGYRLPETAARLALSGSDKDLRSRLSDHRVQQAGVSRILQDWFASGRLLVADPATALCAGEYCTAFADGVPVYRDSNHLTASHARSLAPWLATWLQSP